MDEVSVTPAAPHKRKFSILRFLKRLFLSLFILLILIIGTGIFLAWKYQDEAKALVIVKLNEQLNTRIIVSPEDIDFSVLRNFPNASVDLKNIKMLEAVPGDQKDTLLKAGVVSLQFNIRDLFNKHYVIKRIDLKEVLVNLKIDKKGNDNFHILKSSSDTTTAPPDTNAFALDKIVMKNIRVKYKNLQTKDDDDLTLTKAQFKGNFSSKEYKLEADLEAYIEHIISNKVNYIQERTISLNTILDVKGTVYAIKKADIKLGKLALSVTGTWDHQAKEDIFNLVAGGKDMDIKSACSWMPGKYKKDIEEFKSKGDFHFRAIYKGIMSKKSSPEIIASFGVTQGEIIQTAENLSMKNVELEGEYSSAGKGSFTLHHFSGVLPEGSIKGNLKVDDFSNPMIDAKAEGVADLAELQKFLRIDTIETLTGKVKLNASFDGHIRKTAENLIKEDKTSGSVSFSDVALKLRHSKMTFEGLGGDLTLASNDISVKGLRGKIAHSDFNLDGTFKNIMAWLLLKDEQLTVDASLKSQKIDLNELLTDQSTAPPVPAAATKNVTAGTKTPPPAPYKLTLSRYLDLTLRAEIGDMVFRKFEANDMHGVLRMKDKHLYADPLTFKTMDGTFATRADLDGTRSDSVLIKLDADMQNVSATRLFTEMENFGQQTMQDKNVKGSITAKAQVSIPCGSDLTVNSSKLLAKCDVTIVKGELIKLASLKSMSKFININELEDLKFATLTTIINVSNRVISFPQTQINSNALDLTVAGTQDFDGNVDYIFGLYLSELLAAKAKANRKENSDFGEVNTDDKESKHRFRIYISMTGNIDNPKIAYDHKAAHDERKAKRKEEKEKLKGILNTEFGLFKRDSLVVKRNEEQKKKDGKFSVKFDEEKKKDEGKDESDF
ncbi:MAG: AsmA-like C-terminal region-containing protein [Bacteroidia bacterium]